MISRICNDVKVWRRQHFLLADFMISTLLTFLLMLCVYKIPQIKTLVNLKCEVRGDLYAFASAASVALLGFSITGITILLTLESRENKRLVFLRKSKYYAQIYAVFMQAIYAHSLALILSLAALVFDRASNDTNNLLYGLVIWALILTAFRVWRCIWILGMIIELMVKGEDDIPQGDN